MRKFLSVILCVLLLTGLTLFAQADEAITTLFSKYGNVNTLCTAQHFTEDLGFAWGDMVNVAFLDKTLTLPVVPDYSAVDSGKPAIIVHPGNTGAPDGDVFLAINMGNFAETYGIATKIAEPDGSWHWEPAEGVTLPVKFSFSMAEKGGYMADYLLRSLTRTNDREDYAHLGNKDFANFREITTTGMLPGTLYRTSSPINPELGRNIYADGAVSEAGVRTIVNLADSQEIAASYPDFAATYYAQQNVIYLDLGVDFAAEDFKTGLAKGLVHIAENPGPYAIHCTEGKDRAGFVAAVLECFSGATYEEVIADYMLTYINYYGVEPGTDKYDAIAESNIIKSLSKAFGAEDLKTTDLSAEAEEYIRSLGLTDGQIASLRKNLTGKKENNSTLLAAGLALISLSLILTATISGRRRKK